LRRVTALEEGRNRVTAPFEVVDAAGKAIVAVGADKEFRGLEIYAANGMAVVSVMAKGMHGQVSVSGESSEGSGRVSVSGGGSGALQIYAGDKVVAEVTGEGSNGQVKVFGDSGSTAGTLAVVEDKAGLQLESGDEVAYLRSDELRIASGEKKLTVQASSVTLSDGDKTQAELGEDSKEGNMRLKIMNASGKDVVALGESSALGNSGALVIRDASGEVVATVAAMGAGRGSVNVFGKGASALAEIKVDDNGQGVVAVRDGTGKAVAFLTGSSSGQGGNVTATNPAGDGVFSAGWNGEEGAACVNLKSGMWCMGKNLPLQHGGD
jgi:hypothetical protein